MSGDACCKLAETLGPERLAVLDAELRSPTSRGVKRIARDLGTNHMAVHRHRTGCLGLGGGQTDEAPVTPRTAQAAPAPEPPPAVEGSSPVEKPTPAPELAATSHAPAVPARVTSGGTAREQGGNSEGNTAAVTPEGEGNGLKGRMGNSAPGSGETPPRALELASEKIVPRSPYFRAVDHFLTLITGREWRPAKMAEVMQATGVTREVARKAFSEACRHLQLDMGGYLERQTTSAAWLIEQRDAARKRCERTAEHAEKWRVQEKEANDFAETLDGEEKIAALQRAANFGVCATKYGLEAAKWDAMALQYERQLDDVLRLLGPQTAVQVNVGGDGGADVEAFAAALAKLCGGRADVLDLIEQAAASLARSEPGDEDAIVVASEAA